MDITHKHSKCGTPAEFRPPQSIPRGMLRHFIMLLLQTNEMTGVEIKQEFERRTRGVWSPSPGSIYPNLAELEGCGLVEKIETQERSTPYRLTASGRNHVKMVLRHMPPDPKMRMIPMIWLSFMSPTNRARHLVHDLLFGADSLMEPVAMLSRKEKKSLLAKVKEVRAKLERVANTLENGGQTNDK